MQSACIHVMSCLDDVDVRTAEPALSSLQKGYTSVDPETNES